MPSPRELQRPPQHHKPDTDTLYTREQPVRPLLLPRLRNLLLVPKHTRIVHSLLTKSRQAQRQRPDLRQQPPTPICSVMEQHTPRHGLRPYCDLHLLLFTYLQKGSSGFKLGTHALGTAGSLPTVFCPRGSLSRRPQLLVPYQPPPPSPPNPVPHAHQTTLHMV